MDRMPHKDRVRFDSKVTKTDGCWLMNPPFDADGYATFYFKGKTRRAHRVAYWASVGDIPAGFVVDHICNVRHCVRPEHLRILSPAENRRRTVTGLCKQGHPLDRTYGAQRYCSICSAAKKKRLKAKWRAEGRDLVVGL